MQSSGHKAVAAGAAAAALQQQDDVVPHGPPANLDFFGQSNV